MSLSSKGGLSYIVRTIFSWLGCLIIYAAIFHIEDKTLQWLLGGVGIFIGAIGMYSAQAAMLNLKPFTNDPLGWRKAKQSYTEKDVAVIENSESAPSLMTDQEHAQKSDTKSD